MQRRPHNRTLLFRSRHVLGIALMALGVTLLKLGLPENWIDLTALVLAAVTTQFAGTTPTGPPARKPRRKNRSTKRRAPRGK
ncbi:hypothetical protein [Streptomyces sp. SAI-229]|jgi:hypothetical protein|uniref:hypothetical protein n=1 Tax=Streptomyces sp. SAI-229 TaxID=3377731 RepID=UPI003C7E4F7E